MVYFFSVLKKLFKTLSSGFLCSIFFLGIIEQTTAQAPSISSFSPSIGPVGTLVTINGTNLGSPTAFSIGGENAIVVSNNGTALVGMVMPGATTGIISITKPGGSVNSNSNFSVIPTSHPTTQQGPKLLGNGNIGQSNHGYSVSVSADGNTAIVGGFDDNGSIGAASVYTRSSGTWTQQGPKLVGTGSLGASQQGRCVALSADGNTAIVGGNGDNLNQGAAWVFVRTGSTWAQQGNKLVGTGNTNAAQQGFSVSISADGNTAIMCGFADNTNRGAAWVFTRNGSTWAQQGAKLVGTGNFGAPELGRAVSLSADGNTAMVGGNGDNSSLGAAWVFVRSGGAWTQQGAKLVGTGSIGAARQGRAVALSADGNTAMIGGWSDNAGEGAAWVFTRSGSAWTQQGNKLVANDNTGAAQQGRAVSLSADGHTAMLGGPADNGNKGAVWAFTLAGGNWTQRGLKLAGTGSMGEAQQGFSVSLSANGNTAIVGGLSDNVNQGAAWVFAIPPPTITSFSPVSGPVGTLVSINGTNLGSPAILNIGGVSAIVVSGSETNLVGMVMPGTTTGIVSVSTAGGTTGNGSNFTVTPTLYPNSQQGSKLVGNGGSSGAQQGVSVSVSADGKTAIVGGPQENAGQGAAWIYTRTGDTWMQQGNKLVGTGNTGEAGQGFSVSLSADGNTAIVGGPYDNGQQGAVWVFTRNDTTWMQQGNKLVANDNTGAAQQGISVSLSADGSTAILGGNFDNLFQGAVWVFTRNGNTWTQQGNKLVGTGGSINALQGGSVSLSADGSTAIIGGYADNSFQGAAWVFTRNGSTWAQQGNKLVGTGNTGAASQGRSVSLSADGHTAIIGGLGDNANRGAAWVFTRNGNSWTQQGSKLVGKDNTGAARQGSSVSLTADGNTAFVGGNGDDSFQGATWVYTRSSNTWTQQGSKLLAAGNSGAAGWGGSVSVSADGKTGVVGGNKDNLDQGAAWVLVFPPPPTISSFSPASGPVGTLVTVSGTNLGRPTAFTIGGVGAIVVSNSGKALVGMVMPGAITGAISVTSISGIVNGGSNFTVTPTPYPVSQQGEKLVGTLSSGAQQGMAVSVSADGNTAIVGGPGDNTGQGAAWIYTRIGPTWTQQGPKLVGTGNDGAAFQGIAVSLSADGNTAMVGGYNDNNYQGAAWVFTRNGSTWAQQGNKLVGTGNTGAASQGRSVSLSADGNTAIVGGAGDNSNQGAAWVFTRAGNIWTQQGNKLVGTGSTGLAQQGFSVSLSADGNTAILGGPEIFGQGAVWIFTRNGINWTQQGNKLVGSGGSVSGDQGYSVSLSADGNTAIVGDPADNNFKGAVWLYTRSGITWTQQGPKLVGSGNTNAAQLGKSVSISADGNTAIVGGLGDNDSKGAVWVYNRSGSNWVQQELKLVGTDNIGNSNQGYSASLSADGKTAIIGGHYDANDNGAAWVFIAPASQFTYYFRSRTSGNWNDPNNWESSPVADFSSGVISPATISPGADAKGISIRQNHTVTVTQNVYVRQLFVHPSGVVNVIGCILTQIEN